MTRRSFPWRQLAEDCVPPSPRMTLFHLPPAHAFCAVQCGQYGMGRHELCIITSSAEFSLFYFLGAAVFPC